MYAEFHALDEARLLRFIREVRAITEGPKGRMWPLLFDAIEGFAPRPLLTTSGMVRKPYTAISYHTGPSCGFEDFTRDQVPSWGDPRLAWIMRAMILESTECVLKGRDTRLYATFGLWLPEQRLIDGPEEQAEWDLLRNRIFYNTDPFPEEYRFLEPEGYRALILAEEVASLVSVERRVGLLGRVADRIGQRSLNPYAATELRRLAAFMEFAVADGAALLYTEAG